MVVVCSAGHGSYLLNRLWLLPLEEGMPVTSWTGHDFTCWAGHGSYLFSSSWQLPFEQVTAVTFGTVHVSHLLNRACLLPVEQLMASKCWTINGNISNCPTRCELVQFLFPTNYSTCFGWHLHPSSGEQVNCNYSIWHWSNRMLPSIQFDQCQML
jgi:hypothetical protein